MNIQNEAEKIHKQFGVTERANYEIEKLFNRFHELKLKQEKCLHPLESLKYITEGSTALKCSLCEKQI